MVENREISAVLRTMILCTLMILVIGTQRCPAYITLPTVQETLDVQDGYDQAIYVKSGGTLNITGGTITRSASDASWGISAVEVAGGTVNIRGGALDPGMKLASGTVNIFGKTFQVGETTYGTPGTYNIAINGTLSGSYEDDTPIDMVINCQAATSVTLHVANTGGGNEPPVAEDDSDSTTVNTPVTIDVLQNDSDPDGDELMIESVGAAGDGTVEIVDGSVRYTPGSNFVGTDTFTYSITDGKDGTASATVTVAVNPGSLEIDIKPGDDTNRINLGSNGVIPVAILSAATFDATELDADKIFLAGAGVRVRGKSDKYLASEEDVNGDGLLDLVVKIETQNLDPDTIQDGVAYLRVHASADSSSAVLYEGSDSVTIVPPER